MHERKTGSVTCSTVSELGFFLQPKVGVKKKSIHQMLTVFLIDLNTKANRRQRLLYNKN